MNDRERASADLGIAALNASLAGLGHKPLGLNPHVRMVGPVVGEIPNAMVDQPGVAPLRFVFGLDLDIWIGPYSEVVTSPVNAETRDRVEESITLVLTSEVLCQVGRRSVALTLRIPDQEPWLRLTVRGADQQPSLEPRYQPYARL